MYFCERFSNFGWFPYRHQFISWREISIKEGIVLEIDLENACDHIYCLFVHCIKSDGLRKQVERMDNEVHINELIFNPN